MSPKLAVVFNFATSSGAASIWWVQGARFCRDGTEWPHRLEYSGEIGSGFHSGQIRPSGCPLDSPGHQILCRVAHVAQPALPEEAVGG